MTPAPDQATVTQLDAVIVGAGFGGLYALHMLRNRGLRVLAFDAAGGVGGTWFWNTYPGARCDVESVDYSYSFSSELEQEWEWTERYPTQPEILRYLNHVADRFDLRRDLRLNTQVSSARYDETTRTWRVETSDGAVYGAPICVMAVGNLSAAYLPDYPGVDRFAGRIVHTSRWPAEGVELAGQRVGVIGTGSSGIQVIPAIAREAANVVVFQRTANYSLPAHNRPLEKSALDEIKANYAERRRLNEISRTGIHIERNPASALSATSEERDELFTARWDRGGTSLMGAYSDLGSDLDANATAADFVRRKIAAIVTDESVARSLMPRDHPIGSKRVCVDTGYFQTYNRPNVALVDLKQTPIAELTQAGVVAGGVEHPLDILVLATGFDAVTGALAAVDIRGRDGVALTAKWVDGPVTYLGLMCEGFPNLFILTGPGSPSVLSNVVGSLEHHVQWLEALLDHRDAVGASQVEPTHAAETAWGDHIDELFGKTLMRHANSWFVGANIPGKRRVMPLYTGGVEAYRREAAEIADGGYPGFAFTA